MALPLLPVQDVEKAYQELYENIPVELESFFEYFDGWWMKQVPLQLWNVSNLQSRTNNNVECKVYLVIFVSSFFFVLLQLGTLDSTRESKRNIPISGPLFKHYRMKKFIFNNSLSMLIRAS